MTHATAKELGLLMQHIVAPNHDTSSYKIVYRPLIYHYYITVYQSRLGKVVTGCIEFLNLLNLAL